MTTVVCRHSNHYLGYTLHTQASQQYQQNLFDFEYRAGQEGSKMSSIDERRGKSA